MYYIHSFMYIVQVIICLPLFIQHRFSSLPTVWQSTRLKYFPVSRETLLWHYERCSSALAPTIHTNAILQCDPAVRGAQAEWVRAPFQLANRD